jgi:cytochrome d ubiquinol oxidase subunit II
LGVGLILATTMLGLPLDAHGNRLGSAFASVRGDTLLGAVAIAGFSLVHGATFLSLKTSGDFRERARRVALRLFPFALLPLFAFLVLVQVREGALWTLLPLLVSIAAAPIAWWRLSADRDGQAFTALGMVMVAAAVALFGSLYPDVLPSTGDPATSLTVAGSASSPYTLKVMTWVAGFGAPAVLVYQGWTYWVFRKRLGTRHIPPVHVP